MKKIFNFILLATSLNFIIFSCSSDDNNDNIYTGTDTISEVYEVNPPYFTAKSPYSYYYRKNFSLSNSEHLLIYRQTGTTTSGNYIWELLPSTYSDTYGTVSYNYDFSIEDLSIYVNGNYDIATLNPGYLNNQWFRIVVIPGFFPSSQSTTPPVDYQDYNAVIKYFKIDDSKVKTIEVKK